MAFEFRPLFYRGIGLIGLLLFFVKLSVTIFISVYMLMTSTLEYNDWAWTDC